MHCALVAVMALTLMAELRAQSPSYFSTYDPLKVDNYYLTMDSNDWNTIKGDNTFSIVKPAYFNITGESKILIGVNRKPTLVVSSKVGLKFDINEYFDQNVWHGVKKLSMENGE